MKVKLWQVFLDGGNFMWPILFLSVMALAIILERAIVLILFQFRIKNFLLYLRTKGKEGSPGIPGINQEVFSMVPEKAHAWIEENSQILFDKMSRMVELLAGIGNIAPLLGFMGTIAGMISAFQSIAGADKVTVKLVAGGISQALLTTGFGLAVAIVCMFFDHMYRYFLITRANLVEEQVNSMITPYDQITDEDFKPKTESTES